MWNNKIIRIAAFIVFIAGSFAIVMNVDMQAVTQFLNTPITTEIMTYAMTFVVLVLSVLFVWYSRKSRGTARVKDLMVKMWRHWRYRTLLILGLLIVSGVAILLYRDMLPGVNLPAVSLDGEILAALILLFVIGPLMLLFVLFGLSFGASVTNLLVINPNGNRPSDYDPTKSGANPSYEPDDFGLFTTIENGQAKVIVRGEQFVDAFMFAPGLSFKGEVERNLRETDEEYWSVVPTTTGAGTTPYPLYRWFSFKTLLFGPYRIAWWLWQYLTFQIFGLVFVGIWPIQRLRIYPIEYFEEAKSAQGEFMLRRRLNFSDHYRVYDFQFFIPIDSVDTQDTIPVRMVISKIMQVTNVYRITFRSDNNWTARLFARVPSVINEIVNAIPVADVLSKQGQGQKLTTRLFKAVNDLTTPGKPLHEIGLGLAKDSLTIPDRSALNPEDEKALGEPARADARRRAAELDAKGDAASIRESGEALKAAGEAINAAGPGGLAIAQIEGAVRQAEAAGAAGGTVIVGNPAGVIANPQPRTDG